MSDAAAIALGYQIIQDRFFYTTHLGIVIDVNPDDAVKTAGVTFYVLQPPGHGTPPRQHWSKTLFEVLGDKNGNPLGLAEGEAEPLTQRQIAWVREHWPEYQAS